MATKTVGTSFRTPAKQNLLRKTVGRIAGAAPYIPQKPRAAEFIDLCAGDGHYVDGFDFWDGCSPGILISNAKHVAGAGLDAYVDLYEINRNTFDALIGNLTMYIGMPDYMGEGRAEFLIPNDDPRKPTVVVRAFRESGRNADVSVIGQNSVAFVNNDPNTIHDWAMRPGFISEIKAKTKLCTTFSTMGCNVGGLMMKSEEERDQWYDHLAVIRDALPNNHDLMLAAIDRDCAKWAYLLSVPSVWTDKTEVETKKSFSEIGRNMRITWLRGSTSGFHALTHELFKTKSERQQQEALW